MVLHQNKYVEIILEEENSLIIDKFSSNTKSMLGQEFKEEMHIFVKMCKKHKPKRELVHLLDMQYMIPPSMQTWMNQEIFPQYENIIERMAFLLPTEIFTQLTVKFTMEEEAGQKFLQKYFDNEQEARKWLMEE